MSAALIDADAAGELLAVPPAWLMRAARRGQVPHIKLGRYTRFDRDRLLAWADARTVGPVASSRDEQETLRHR